MMKSIVKQLCYAVAILLVAPLAFSERFARSLAGRDVFFQTHNEMLSLLPGKPGSFLRNAYLYLTLQGCPLECFFSFGVMFMHSEAKVGERVYAGAYCIIGQSTIGDDTMLADHVYILSGKRQHGTHERGVRFQDQAGSFTQVHIGRNCWVGSNSTIMADIGDDCVIGAGSVVTRPIPPGQVAVGNPARVIRATFSNADPKVQLPPSSAFNSTQD